VSADAEVLYGWEQHTAFVRAEGVTRGQAKALVAWEIGELFTDMRCRSIWMAHREITEDEACELLCDDWYPGYVGYIQCDEGPGAERFWWVDYKRAFRSAVFSAAPEQT
jgi:hypothetical protein